MKIYYTLVSSAGSTSFVDCSSFQEDYIDIGIIRNTRIVFHESKKESERFTDSNPDVLLSHYIDMEFTFGPISSRRESITDAIKGKYK